MTPALLAFLFYLIAVLIVVVTAVQGLQGKVELLSMRNLYLAGFIVYQLHNPAQMLTAEQIPMFRVNNVKDSGLVLLLYAIVFVPVFFVAYHKTFLWKRAAKVLQVKPRAASPPMLLAVAVALLVFSVALRFMPAVPVITSIAGHMGSGLCAVACGLAGWAWAKNRSNFFVAMVSGAVFLTAIVSILARGDFGRRGLLVLGIGLAWGIYYSLSKQLKPVRLLAWSVPALIATMLVVSAFTAVRGITREGASLQQVVKAMLTVRLQQGTGDLASGQTCGAAALWCVENYPRPNEYRHLFSLRQMVNQFVPRFLWEDKPKPLANHLAKLANIRGVNQSLITLPPGVLGYAAAEGGLYAAIVYAIFFGGVTRFFDEVVRLNINDPSMVNVVAVVTGHMMGLARGDIANFTVNAFIAFITTMIAVAIFRRFVGRPVEQRFETYRYQLGA